MPRQPLCRRTTVTGRFSDRTYSPHDRMRDPQGRVIHIDIDATEFSKHRHQCVNLQADAKKALRSLICAMGSTPVQRPRWTGRALQVKASHIRDDDRDCVPIAPQRVMREINRLIDDDTIVTTDVGQNQMWAMHYLDIEHPRQFLTSGTFGTMGFGLPAAIGAKAALPEKKVMTITGDGGLQMVIQELATSVAENLPVTVVLLNNGCLGMIKQMQKYYWNGRYSAMELGDDPDFVTGGEAGGDRRRTETGDGVRRHHDRRGDGGPRGRHPPDAAHEPEHTHHQGRLPVLMRGAHPLAIRFSLNV